MADIIPPRESWSITNISGYTTPLNFSRLPSPVSLANGATIDLLSTIAIPNNLNTYTSILYSEEIRNALYNGLISTTGYLHTHDDKSDVGHTHTGLDILTAGSGSSADSLHTHNLLVSKSDLNNQVVQILDQYDFSDYVRKDGSINQLADITSTGDKFEEAVLKMHDQIHTIESHGTIATAANLDTLVNGSNADCLHTHSFSLEGITGVHNELERLNEGDYVHLTAAEYVEFGTLTHGGSADGLHTHSGLTGVHNDLEGLQGGTSYNPSATPEYYHLDYDQYISLTGGPSVYADDLHTHNFAATADLIPLGEACDSSWEDGLFQWTTETMTACAIDDINELLASLAPPPAPALDNASVTTAGVTANLSFDSSNPIGEGAYSGVDGIGALPAVTIDLPFTDSGYRTGVIGLNTDVVGTLNDDVAAHAYSYPSDAFGNADQGELILELNGVEIRTIDLSTDGAVDDGLATSGFTITDHIANEFSNGDPFNQFQYRTGTWRVDGSTVTTDMRLGWNYVRIIHRISGVDTVTNYVDWVVDGNKEPTSYSSIAFDNLVMTGSSYLSGVQYYTGGTAQYDVTISNGQRNTWKSGNAITFVGVYGSMSATSFSNTSGNELVPTVITNRTFTISGDGTNENRLLNQNISVYTSVDRTISPNEGVTTELSSTPAAAINSILMDPAINHVASMDASENFNGEGYRMPYRTTSPVFDVTNTSYGSGGPGAGPVVWDYTKTISNAGDDGYNNGLLVYNSRLQYPTQGLLSGDFRSVSGGGSITYAPSGNPTYTGATGNRVYLRYFYDSAARQNFRFSFTFSSTTFVSVATGPSSNNVIVELLAPNTTVNGSSVVEWKDMVTAYSVDTTIGAYASTYGANINTSSPNSWGATIGSKSTATSGKVIVIRITAASSWTGNISDISCTFL